MQGQRSSTDAKKVFKRNEDDLSFLDFETFVSQQKIFYFGPDLEFGMLKFVFLYVTHYIYCRIGPQWSFNFKQRNEQWKYFINYFYKSNKVTKLETCIKACYGKATQK